MLCEWHTRKCSRHCQQLGRRLMIDRPKSLKLCYEAIPEIFWIWPVPRRRENVTHSWMRNRASPKVIRVWLKKRVWTFPAGCVCVQKPYVNKGMVHVKTTKLKASACLQEEWTFLRILKCWYYLHVDFLNLSYLCGTILYFKIHLTPIFCSVWSPVHSNQQWLHPPGSFHIAFPAAWQHSEHTHAG